MEEVREIKEKRERIIRGIIVGKEIINEKAYAYVSCGLGKVLIEEDELHDLNAADKIGLLLGAEIDFIADSFDDELGAYPGSRKKANEAFKNQLYKLETEKELNTTIIIVSKNNIYVNIYGNDIKIKAKDLKMGWIEDLREKFKVGQKLRVKINSIDPPDLEVIEYRKSFEADKYKVGSEYVAKVVGIPKFGIIAEIEEGRQVLCHHVDWQNEPKIGDYVAIRISAVNSNEQTTFGHVKRRIRR